MEKEPDGLWYVQVDLGQCYNEESYIQIIIRLFKKECTVGSYDAYTYDLPTVLRPISF